MNDIEKIDRAKKSNQKNSFNRQNDKIGVVDILRGKKPPEKPLKVDELEKWYKLDNAALIYPSAGNDHWNAVFRISAKLFDVVEPDVLQKALEDIMPRFPSFNVYLKRGLFWYFFGEIKKRPVIEKEVDYPCSKVEFRNQKHLFRVLYYNKTISLESFHSITDGFGASCFLNALVARYLVLKGNEIDLDQCEINYLDKPTDEEVEDSFIRYADLKETSSRKEKSAYQVHGTREDRGKLNVMSGCVSVEELKKIAKSFNATITAYVTALYIKIILDYQKNLLKQPKQIKISVPVNLRKIFPSQTLRNFSTWGNVCVDRNFVDKPFQELVDIVTQQMKSCDKSKALKNINANIKAQRNILVRVMPLAIKNLALKISYSQFGEKLYTSVVSNIGIVKAPKQFDTLVDRYYSYLGPGKTNTITMCLISFNDKLTINFSRVIKEKKIEREFFRALSDAGLRVEVICN